MTLGDAQILDSLFPKQKSLASLSTTSSPSTLGNVGNVCKATHFHIRALRHIRGCIDEETACMVASSMVGPYYCQSTLTLVFWNLFSRQTALCNGAFSVGTALRHFFIQKKNTNYNNSEAMKLNIEI